MRARYAYAPIVTTEGHTVVVADAAGGHGCTAYASFGKREDAADRVTMLNEEIGIDVHQAERILMSSMFPHSVYRDEYLAHGGIE